MGCGTKIKQPQSYFAQDRPTRMLFEHRDGSSRAVRQDSEWREARDDHRDQTARLWRSRTLVFYWYLAGIGWSSLGMLVSEVAALRPRVTVVPKVETRLPSVTMS